MNATTLAQYFYANRIPVREIVEPPPTSNETGTVTVNADIAVVMQGDVSAIVLDLRPNAERQMQSCSSYISVVATIKELRAQAA